MEWTVKVWDWDMEVDFTWFTGSHTECKQFIVDNHLTVVNLDTVNNVFGCE